MEFIRYQLWSLEIPHASSPANLFDLVESGLAGRLNGTNNLDGGNIGRSGSVIQIPEAAHGYIRLDDTGLSFRIEIQSEGTQLLVTAYGRSGSTERSERAIQLRYAMVQRPGAIFNYGVASKGPVVLDSNARIVGTPNPAHGSVLSTTTSSDPAVTVTGNAVVSGSISVVDPTGGVVVDTKASVAGSLDPAVKNANIHRGVEEPDFPTIDTDIYKPFATNVISTAGGKFDKVDLKNLYIKANTNPTFGSNIKVQGVIYIETPNKVTFDSNVEITGAIVVQNNPTGSPADNVLIFDSMVKLNGMDKLPDTEDFPPEMRALQGAMILAPGFRLYFDSNFGTAGGSIVGSQIEFDANAVGTVAGGIINLADREMSFDSNAAITIANQGAAYAPAGMYFGSRYVPMPASYLEIVP